MRVAVLAIGDELLKGATINTNAADIGVALLQIGVMVESQTVLPDTKAPIVAHVRSLCESGVDVIIITGGLGPTDDDLTIESVAEALGQSLTRDASVVHTLQTYWAQRFQKPLPPCNLKQADRMLESEWIPNLNGTANGQYVRHATTHIFILPGPPRELKPMLHDFVVPHVATLLDCPVYSQTLYVYTLPESQVAQETIEVLRSMPQLRLAWCAVPSMIRIFLLTEDADALATSVCLLKKHFGVLCLEKPVEALLFDLMKIRHDILVTAESCTGGLLGERLTQIPGISQVYHGGLIVYDNQLKVQYLDVDPFTLEHEGAVSESCCNEMICGLMQAHEHATAGIAITGIAGPASDDSQKKIGLVYIATFYQGHVCVKEYHFSGSRERIRNAASTHAFFQLYSQIIC